MLKKILAVLAILGMLCVGGGNILHAGPQDIPLIQKFMHKISTSDLQHLGRYIMKHGQLDFFTFLFTGIIRFTEDFPQYDVQLSIEVYPSGDAYIFMTQPYGTEGRMLAYVERCGDGELLVDAVGILDVNGALEYLLYPFGGDVPSIYSVDFVDKLSKIIYGPVYDEPIEHAIVYVGEDENAGQEN